MEKVFFMVFVSLAIIIKTLMDHFKERSCQRPHSPAAYPLWEPPKKPIPAPPPPRRPTSWDDVKPRKPSVSYWVISVDPRLMSTFPAKPPSGERLGKYTIFNSEGEVYTIDTSNHNSPFYGPAWDKILDALTGEKNITGKITGRKINSGNNFVGYEVLINGVKAFLPRNESGPYRNFKKDPTGVELQVRPFLVYPSGRRKGSLLVRYDSLQDDTTKGGKNAQPLSHP